MGSKFEYGMKCCLKLILVHLMYLSVNLKHLFGTRQHLSLGCNLKRWSCGDNQRVLRKQIWLCLTIGSILSCQDQAQILADLSHSPEFTHTATSRPSFEIQLRVLGFYERVILHAEIGCGEVLSVLVTTMGTSCSQLSIVLLCLPTTAWVKGARLPCSLVPTAVRRILAKWIIVGCFNYITQIATGNNIICPTMSEIKWNAHLLHNNNPY